MRPVCEFKMNGIGGRDEYGRRVCGNCGRAEELHPAPAPSPSPSSPVLGVPVEPEGQSQRVAAARQKLWDDTRCKAPMHCNECDKDATCQREHVHRPGFHAAGNHKWTDDLVVHI